jgi:hypothetical protein
MQWLLRARPMKSVECCAPHAPSGLVWKIKGSDHEPWQQGGVVHARSLADQVCDQKQLKTWGCC